MYVCVKYMYKYIKFIKYICNHIKVKIKCILISCNYHRNVITHKSNWLDQTTNIMYLIDEALTVFSIPNFCD